MSEVGYNPLSGKYDYAVVEVKTGRGVVELTWVNSRLRLFANYILVNSEVTIDEENFSPYDHMEWKDEEGRVSGLVMPKEMLGLFYSFPWPHRFDCIVDLETMEWKEAMENEDLDDLIKMVNEGDL